jgi:hypothetical protein
MSLLLEIFGLCVVANLVLGVIAVAFKLPEKLIDTAVSKRAAAIKHEYDAKLEGLRDRLALLSDRGKRSNELEYQAVRAAWEAFVDAYVQTMNTIVSWTSTLNLNDMSDEEVQETLGWIDYKPDLVKNVMDAVDRDKAYARIEQARRLDRAHTANFNAISIIRKQGIFIPKGLEVEFMTAMDVVQRGYATQFMRAQYPDSPPPPDTNSPNLLSDGQRVLDDLKGLVRSHLLKAVGDEAR